MAATFQRVSGGRLLLNIVVGGDEVEQRRFGDFLSKDDRYAQADEFLHDRARRVGARVVRLRRRAHHASRAPSVPDAPQWPQIYFGGSSPAALEVAARHADVYLTWGEPPAQVAEKLDRVRAAADARGPRAALRHPPARDHARDRPRRRGRRPTGCSPGSTRRRSSARRRTCASRQSEGQRRMVALHERPHGPARGLPRTCGRASGWCAAAPGTALVGCHEEVADRIAEYHDLGIDEFILSGYPHLEEAYHVGEGVRPILRERGLLDGPERAGRHVTAAVAGPARRRCDVRCAARRGRRPRRGEGGGARRRRPAGRARPRRRRAGRPGAADGLCPRPGRAGPLRPDPGARLPPGPRRARCPAIAYFHGGGWTVGSIDSFDGVARRLAAASGSLVVSVGYRLAPEHPFPAPVEEGLAVRARRLARDGGRVAVAGDSAGGNLAAVIARRLRDEGGRAATPRPGARVPRAATRRSTPPSADAFAEGYGFTRAAMRRFWELYLGGADGRHPDASPLRAPWLRGLPPALVDHRGGRRPARRGRGVRGGAARRGSARAAAPLSPARCTASGAGPPAPTASRRAIDEAGAFLSAERWRDDRRLRVDRGRRGLRRRGDRRRACCAACEPGRA